MNIWAKPDINIYLKLLIQRRNKKIYVAVAAMAVIFLVLASPISVKAENLLETGYAPLLSMEEYTSVVNSIEEARRELDKVLIMRVRKWNMKIGDGAEAAIGAQIWNEIGSRIYQPLQTYNESCIRNVVMYGTKKDIVFEIIYPSLEQEIAVEMVVLLILPQLNEGSDYEKVLKTHDYLCRQVTYTINDSQEIHEAYGALVDGKAVCDGYAAAFQRFMDAMGIPCYTANGMVGGINHAWNVVQLDGQWHQIDVTYSDKI